MPGGKLRQILLALGLGLVPAAPAGAFPGLVLGESSGRPAVDGLVALAAVQPGQVVWTLAPRVTGGGSRFGLLLPLPAAFDLLSASAVSPEALAQLDAFGAPRLDETGCDLLIERNYLYTAPACRTTEEIRAAEEPRSAVESWNLYQDPQIVRYQFALVSDDPERGLPSPEGWATPLQLVLPPLGPAGQARQAEGQIWLAVLVEASEPLPAEPTWLVPFRFPALSPVPTLAGDLAVEAGAPQQDWVVHLVAPTSQGAWQPSAGAPLSPPTDCLLAALDPLAWYTAEVDAAQALMSPPGHVLEYSGPLDTCQPCTSPLLSDLQLSSLGSAAGGADSWLTSLRLRFSPRGSEFELAFSPTLDPRRVQQRTWAYLPELEAALPVCGEGFVQDPESCPDLALSPSGCQHRPPWWVGGLGPWLLLPWLWRRRGGALWLALLLVSATAAPRAAAEEGNRPVPRASTGVTLVGWSTPRVVPEDSRGGPWPASPWLGADLDLALIRLRRTSFGLAVGYRGAGGKMGAAGEQRWSLHEPSIGASGRLGSFQDRRLSGFFRYGLRANLGFVDSNVWVPHALFGTAVQVGGGAWVGRGARRLELELKAQMIPRTDAWRVEFDPLVDQDGWVELPGGLDVTLRAALAFP